MFFFVTSSGNTPTGAELHVSFRATERTSAITRPSISPQSRITWLAEMPLMPMALTRSLLERVEILLIFACWITDVWAIPATRRNLRSDEIIDPTQVGNTQLSPARQELPVAIPASVEPALELERDGSSLAAAACITWRPRTGLLMEKRWSQEKRKCARELEAGTVTRSELKVATTFSASKSVQTSVSSEGLPKTRKSV